MTVIRDKQNFYPKPNTPTASDTESLNLGSVSASDTESLNNEPIPTTRIRAFRPPPVKVSQIEELLHLKKSSGKKKQRRYENRCVLQTLNEEEENENMIIIMESYKSPFARLLEDKNALEYWNNFIEKSEEEQTKIVKAFSEKFKNHMSQDCTSRSEKPHGQISSRIRRTFKIKKHLSLEIVQSSEDDMIEFFKTTPNGTYVKYPPTSFERLLLHAIAQYHRLKSMSILHEDGAKRSVEVYNIKNDWSPADCFLTDFIKQLRR